MTKLKMLRVSQLILLCILLLALTFYFGIVLPEHYACPKFTHEGEKGITIWGTQTNCDTESQDIENAFFVPCTIVVIAISLFCFLLLFRIKKIKRESSLINPFQHNKLHTKL